MIRSYSNEWQEIVKKVTDHKTMWEKGLRIGNKQNQYEDTVTRWETIGYLNALEWILNLADKE